MESLFAFSIFSFSLLFESSPVKADWTHYVFKNIGSSNPGKLYKYYSETGESEFITNFGPVMNADDTLSAYLYILVNLAVFLFN